MQLGIQLRGRLGILPSILQLAVEVGDAARGVLLRLLRTFGGLRGQRLLPAGFLCGPLGLTVGLGHRGVEGAQVAVRGGQAVGQLASRFLACFQASVLTAAAAPQCDASGQQQREAQLDQAGVAAHGAVLALPRSSAPMWGAARPAIRPMISALSSAPGVRVDAKYCCATVTAGPSTSATALAATNGA